ncbi:methylated-DNA--[protein]-cysteine S-methyltransferase [Microbacterium sp. P04]|uniref:methylated-DNA--[protein]-cysteine S-methyltransferase n=1 Tax=Microbacterium sp. P04 TaxID=3366947 RepID=UPI0037450A5D
MTRFTTSWHSTPVGDVLAAFADDALIAVSLEHGARDEAIARISGVVGEAPEHDDTAAAELGTQLDEYFAGFRRTFDLQLDWRLANGFTRQALEAIREIPYGETASYGEVAARAGSPRAARAVGAACRTTPFSLVVPVHRVVRADGSIGEYGGHPEVKHALLALEGVVSE